MQKQKVLTRLNDKNKIKKTSSSNVINNNNNKPQMHSTTITTTTGESDIEIAKNKQHIESLEKELELIKRQLKDAECSLERTKGKIEEVDNTKKKKSAEFDKAKSKCENEEEIKEILQDKCRDLERQIHQINHQQSDDNENEDHRDHQLNTLLNLLFLSHRQRDNEHREPGMNLQEIEKIKVDKYKHNNNNDTQQCDICGFELCNNDFVMMLPKCKHLFHKECLVNKLQQTGQCPLCKMKVNN